MSTNLGAIHIHISYWFGNERNVDIVYTDPSLTHRVGQETRRKAIEHFMTLMVDSPTDADFENYKAKWHSKN